MVLYFEYPAGNINTAENALWCLFCTVTTIGYGDMVPITTGGRIFTVIEGVNGIGMFGIMSSLIFNKIINLKVNEKN